MVPAHTENFSAKYSDDLFDDRISSTFAALNLALATRSPLIIVP